MAAFLKLLNYTYRASANLNENFIVSAKFSFNVKAPKRGFTINFVKRGGTIAQAKQPPKILRMVNITLFLINLFIMFFISNSYTDIIQKSAMYESENS
jgi:hypothetical protein